MKEKRKVWRQEAGSIISQKKKHERDLLHEKPANQIYIKRWMNMAFH